MTARGDTDRNGKAGRWIGPFIHSCEEERHGAQKAQKLSQCGISCVFAEQKRNEAPNDGMPFCVRARGTLDLCPCFCCFVHHMGSRVLVGFVSAVRIATRILDACSTEVSASPVTSSLTLPPYRANHSLHSPPEIHTTLFRGQFHAETAEIGALQWWRKVKAPHSGSRACVARISWRSLF
jgi:hypothetical protein